MQAASNPGTHAVSGVTQGAAITIPQDSIHFLSFHVGAENLNMTGTTKNEVFVYKEIK